MKIEYTTTPEDMEALYCHLLSSPQVRRNFWKRSGVTALSMAVVMFLLAESASHNHWAAVVVSLVCALPLLFLYPSVLRHESTVASRRQVMADPVSPALGSHSLEITADRVTEVSPHHTLSVDWSAIRSITRTEHHFFIQLSNLSVIVIPISSFESSEATEKFRQYVVTIAPANVVMKLHPIAR